MRFKQFFQPNQHDQMHTVKLGNEHGAVKTGTSSHNQHYTRRKELESNRKHIGAYHASKIAQSHLVSRQRVPRPATPRPQQTIDIVRRPGGVQRPTPNNRPTVSPGGHHFKEPPSRNRPAGY